MQQSTEAPYLPTVGVVIPTFGRPGMLARLLQSLSIQTYPNDRMAAVVVGGARDHARQLVNSFGGSAGFQISYEIVPDSEESCVSRKRNIGTRVVRGEIIAFVDDDCEADRDWISAAVPSFRDPKVGGVEGAIYIPQPTPPTPTYRASLRLSLAQGYRTGNIFYRRSTFEECGGFDESLPYYEDTDLGCTVIGHGYSIPFVKNAVVAHAVQEGRPLWHLKMARTADQLPYLFAKHARTKPLLRRSVHLFNRSHYVYLAIYGLGLLVGVEYPVLALLGLVITLPVVASIQLALQWRGLHFSARELLLTAASLPVVPLVRMAFLMKGIAEKRFGLRNRRVPARR